jgi:hypothetical protein
MKKIYLLLVVIAIFAMEGCVKDKLSNALNNKDLDNKDLVSQMFTAGMSSYSQAQTGKSQTEKSTVPINISVDNTVYGPEGGNIHVIGSITGSFSFDDQTSSLTGGTMLLGLTETINSYAFTSNGNTYTMSGDPYISLTGTFTLLAGGNTFGTASSMQIGGGVRVTGTGYDQTVNIDITININSSGTGGDVSGTIGGESIYYTF